ncbi:MAG: hypothetical protein UV36_C0013G0002 [Parcubacteria group bacterium GW2011_GWC2_42_6]|nr:MAG: hypothetical protein UU87_C0002G0027 [Parcubacteria group bacterium GW2011_GWA2_42_11]KKS67084.1 MAG: hypothetical protein UV36_C0013G0002 [Parcubacteria group bacterium GW2011_GWC2_42_6]
MSRKKPCSHCGPLPANHWESWINDWLVWFFNKFEARIKKIGGGFLGKPILFFENQITAAVIWLLLKSKIISLTADIDRSKIYNRTLVFLDEAKKKGYRAGAVLFLGRYNNQFFIEISGQRIFFEGLPLGRQRRNIANIFIDDKARLKEILRNHGLPFVIGQSFFSRRAACRYGLKLGWPLVVKPRWGSVSRHVFVDINSKEKLKEAIKNVKEICPWVVVEKFLTGASVWRATVVDYKLGGVVKRIPANVVGDGVSSIAELVETKNADPRRGEPKQKDCTYLKIVLDQTSAKLLAAQKLAFGGVPARGQQVWLQEKIILDLGADLLDATGAAHPDNIKIFEQAARVFGAQLVGIDFLCRDIGVSWREQECAIIELNSLPFIDMHHYPLEGQPRNIAAMLLAMMEEEYKINK